MTCHMSFHLGGYALHALDPRLEHAVEQHLVECDECLDELGELAFTASLLALLQPEDAEMLDGPDPAESASPPSALSSGRPGPGRNGKHVRRRAVLAAVATVAMGAGGPAPRVRAEVSMVTRDEGTGLHLTLVGAPQHGWCSLVARSADGSSEIAARWPADGVGRVDVSGSTAIPPRS